MFEVICGILAGLLVKDWTGLIAYPCCIGLCEAVTLALRCKSFSSSNAAIIALMRADGCSENDIAGFDLINQLAPSGCFLYLHQFVWSTATAFPSCLIVGGIKLGFFE